MELIVPVVGLGAAATLGAVAVAVWTVLAWLRAGGQSSAAHRVVVEIDGSRTVLEGDSVPELERSFHRRILETAAAAPAETSRGEPI